ncbi:MAG: CapA family protein, partial [Clostridia bacterium]|nr:CapA family protein [Clostridia bacterium]
MKKITLLLALCLTLCACESKSEGQPQIEEIQQEAVVETVPEPPVPESEPEPLVVTLAMCGDVMSHMPVTNDVKNEEYSYARILAGAEPYVSAADYAVANFETTMAGGPNYSGYPCFNSPDG